MENETSENYKELFQEKTFQTIKGKINKAKKEIMETSDFLKDIGGTRGLALNYLTSILELYSFLIKALPKGDGRSESDLLSKEVIKNKEIEKRRLEGIINGLSENKQKAYFKAAVVFLNESANQKKLSERGTAITKEFFWRMRIPREDEEFKQEEEIRQTSKLAWKKFEKMAFALKEIGDKKLYKQEPLSVKA